MEATSAYLPMDRRQALAWGRALPEWAQGAALFADVSGFTPLTEALAQDLGPKRGAEELTNHLNRVYNALIDELHRYGGSVIGFSGDAITCWLDGDEGERAIACALAMQRAMQDFAVVETASGRIVTLGMKAAVATGRVRRMLVGDPECCLVEVIAGKTLERLASAERLAEQGEVILDSAAVASLGGEAIVGDWRVDGRTGARFGVVAGLKLPVAEAPWPPLPPGALSDEQVRAWLLPPVFHRLQSGRGEFLAELRPAVALFLRFTGLDYDGDPTAPDKLDAFVRGVQGIAKGYEGSLLSLTIGDKGSYLYIAWGAPVAHEDHAARAASAALALQSLAASLDYLSPVQIGITQGRMRTGAYGSRTRRAYSAIGDAVNLSARLMTAAEPGQILASDPIRAAAGDAYLWEDLPAIQVKGKREPVPVSWLVAARERRTIGLLEPSYALPMVGRTEELALIEQRLRQALQGRGQIVGITAEAGMGKSRLAAEVIRLARQEGLECYGGECQSYGTGTSYLVWQSIWRGIFDVDPAAPPEQQIHTLEGGLRNIDPWLLPRLPLLGAVLSLAIPDTDLTRSLEAKVRKSSLEALLVDCLRAKAKEQPILLVLEDCHWLDPLSRDLIEVLARPLAGLPVLLLLVYRPWDAHDLRAPRVSELPHFTEVALTEFSRQEAERLIRLKLERFFGYETAIPPSFLAQITERAAGNPFYIEELLNYLQDRGIQPEDSEALAAVGLPTSLTSLILSRLDQLTETQQTTVRVASVIGRLFPAAMVWGVHPELGSYTQVKADLQALSTLDLTPIDAPEPELTYLFKHIITQEVAYESLLYATRAVLHGQIGWYLEETHHGALDQVVNLLAFHYEHSDNEVKKREYLLKAGEAAQADYANEVAVQYYQKVLPLLSEEQQVYVYLRLGAVLELVGEWDEADQLYQRALSQASVLRDLPGQANAQIAIGELRRKQGQFSEAASWYGEAKALSAQSGDQAGVAKALICAGTLSNQQGDHAAARTLYEQSLDIRRRLDDQPNIAKVLNNLGIVARSRGDYPLARSYHQEALAIRRELRDKWAIAASLNNLGNVANDQGQYAQGRRYLEEAVSIQREIGDKWYLANALNNLANVMREEGQYEAARALYTESLLLNRDLGDKWALAYLLEDVGYLAALQDQPEQALRLVSAASVLRKEIGAPLSPTEADKLDSALEPARQALSKKKQARAQALGAALSLEGAIDEALSVQTSISIPSRAKKVPAKSDCA